MMEALWPCKSDTEIVKAWQRRYLYIRNIIIIILFVWQSIFLSQWPPWLMTSVGMILLSFPSLIRHRGYNAGAACGAGHDYPSGGPAFTSGFHRGSCCPVICVSLFHAIILSFGIEFWLFFLFDCLVSIFFAFISILVWNIIGFLKAILSH